MNQQKSLFKQAAECGLPFGAYLSVMASGFIFYDKHIALSALALAMVLATPFVVYRWLKKRSMCSGGTASFSDLWMMGILIFLCGSIIACGVSYAVMELLRPGIFFEQAHHIISQYDASPEAFGKETQQVVDILRLAIDKHAAPRCIELALTGFWTCAFAGSLLSAALAAIVKLTSKRI